MLTLAYGHSEGCGAYLDVLAYTVSDHLEDTGHRPPLTFHCWTNSLMSCSASLERTSVRSPSLAKKSSRSSEALSLQDDADRLNEF